MIHKLRRGWRKKTKQLLSNPSKKTTPVFVVGCGRSGTSMLVHHLSRSWTVDSYNENNEAAFERWRLRPLDVIEQIVKKSRAHVILFKPVLNTPHSREYLTKFPEAKLIFVYRHFNDVVNSSLKRFGPTNRLTHVNAWMDDDFSEFAPIAPPELAKEAVREHWTPSLSFESGAALYWLFYNNLYLSLGLDQDDRVMLVGYESLVTEPNTNIECICAFLDLKYDPSMVEDIFSASIGRDTPPLIDPHILNSCQGLWQQLQQRS